MQKMYMAVTNPLERKQVRIPDYDYSQNGAYFVTICAKDRKCLFGQIPVVGGDVYIAPKIQLSQTGIVIREIIEQLPHARNDIRVDRYVILPNHLHLIVIVERGEPDDVDITLNDRGDVDIAPYGQRWWRPLI